MPAERKTGTKPMKSERTHEENQERAYIAASRRSDRSLEARVESARRASEIHKKRTGKALRITEKDVMNEEMYEEEDDEIPQIPFRNAFGFYPADARLHDFLQYKLMLQQAVGPADPKTPLAAFQKYQLTNPQPFNPYALGGTMYTHMPYQDPRHAQQYLSIAPQTIKSPGAQAHALNRFHPYAKPTPAQKRQYPAYQIPVIDSRFQTPTVQVSPQVTQTPQLASSPSTQPACIPQKAQLQSPTMSHISNRGSDSQAQTPILTHSSAGSTPAPTAAGSSPLAASPVVATAQNDSDDTICVSPLTSALSPDVQTFLSPTYMSSMLHSNEYNLDDLDFLKSLDTLSSTQPIVGQAQFNFSDVFDTSVFNATASLTNTKSCADLHETPSSISHYRDASFDASILGIDQKSSHPHSLATDFLSPAAPLDQLKTPTSADGSVDFLPDTWLFQDSNSWPADEGFWSPLGDLDAWTHVVGPPTSSSTPAPQRRT